MTNCLTELLPRELLAIVQFYSYDGILPIKDQARTATRFEKLTERRWNLLVGGYDEAAVVAFLRRVLVRPLFFLRCTCRALYEATWLNTPTDLFDWLYDNYKWLFPLKGYFIRELWKSQVGNVVNKESPPNVKMLGLAVKLGQPSSTIVDHVKMFAFSPAFLRENHTRRLARLVQSTFEECSNRNDIELFSHLVTCAKNHFTSTQKHFPIGMDFKQPHGVYFLDQLVMDDTNMYIIGAADVQFKKGMFVRWQFTSLVEIRAVNAENWTHADLVQKKALARRLKQQRTDYLNAIRANKKTRYFY